jgi:lipoprotein-releasing system permease protein
MRPECTPGLRVQLCGTLARVQYEMLVGLRYIRAKRRNRFVSFIPLVSMLGIALGVAALIVILSVMNGFHKELRARILGVASHVQIGGQGGRIAGWPKVAEQASQNPQVVAAAPFVDAQAMVSSDRGVRGTVVRGIEPLLEEKVADIGSHMVAGSLDDLEAGSFRVVLGIELARALGAGRGDKVTLVSPQGLMTPAGLVPRLKQFTVSGVFEIGTFEYDSALALVHLGDAQRLYSMGDRVSGVRLKLRDLFSAPEVAREIGERLGVPVTDWTRSHASFFRAVQIEKYVMFVILLLIVTVAACNVVSTLVMVVTDKQPDIAILRTLGASPRGIMKIFMVQGALIGVLGTLVGVAGGIALALNVDVVVPFLERLLNLQVLPADLYYITTLPSDLQRGDVLVITLVSLVISLLATLYPSWRASRVDPVDALRYE